MTEHLGHEKHEPVANVAGNTRNGRSRKTLKGEFGELPIEIPRDRDGTFEPRLVPKHQARWSGFDDKILSLYARGMTVREIQAHLELSKKTRGNLPQGRGRMTALEDRRQIVDSIGEAHRAGARLDRACTLAGIDVRTLQRWRRQGSGTVCDDRRTHAQRPPPAHALSEAERIELLRVANEPRFAALPPAQIVPRPALPTKACIWPVNRPSIACCARRGKPHIAATPRRLP